MLAGLYALLPIALLWPLMRWAHIAIVHLDDVDEILELELIYRLSSETR